MPLIKEKVYRSYKVGSKTHKKMTKQITILNEFIDIYDNESFNKGIISIVKNLNKGILIAGKYETKLQSFMLTLPYNTGANKLVEAVRSVIL